MKLLDNIYNNPILILLLAISIGQDFKEPFENYKIGKEYSILKINNAPIIDGYFEPIWNNTMVIDDFLQESPKNQGIPSEKSEVYLMYNDNYLFIYAKLFDETPDSIYQILGLRDDWDGVFEESSDWFSVDIDSQHDHVNGFSFVVNASGVLADEIIFEDSFYDGEWDAIWSAESHISNDGWSVEIAIPFSMLRFSKHEPLVWGINFTRYIKRKDETISWVVLPSDFNGICSHFGHLKGLEGIYPPAKFEFRPYILIGPNGFNDKLLPFNPNCPDCYSGFPDTIKSNYYLGFNGEIGFDLKYRLNSSNYIDLTFLPDFGQIEADPEEINLTAYETYYPEKRSFFNENMHLFTTPIDVFYSRRIGESKIRQEYIYNIEYGDSMYTYKQYKNKILAATKFTSYYNGFSIGLLYALTDMYKRGKRWSGIKNNYFVSRIKKDMINANSHFGFISTFNSENNNQMNLAFDTKLNLFNNDISNAAQFIFDNKGLGYYFKNKINLISFLNIKNLEDFQFHFQHYYFDNQINFNTLGYLRRNDISGFKAYVMIDKIFHQSFFRSSYLNFQYIKENNNLGLKLVEEFDLELRLKTNNQWTFLQLYYFGRDHYDDRLITIDDDLDAYGAPVLIPGSYGVSTYISSDSRKKIKFSNLLMIAQNRFDDYEQRFEFDFKYNPNPSLEISMSYNRIFWHKNFDWIEWAIGEDFPDIKNYYAFDRYIDTLDCQYSEECNIDYIFGNLNHSVSIYTIRLRNNFNKNLSLQMYAEYYKSKDIYDDYYLYNYDLDNDYISLFNQNDFSSSYYYTTNISDLISFDYACDVQDSQCENRIPYLDPNYNTALFPKYSNVNFNGVVKWNYITGSNIYLVVSLQKYINGFEPDNIFDFLTYELKDPWTETYNNYSIYLKIDYWLNF